MTVDDERVLRRQLVERVRARRIDIDGFLDRARPRNSRLATVGIVSSALAAVFTGGPAIGGETFAKAAQGFVGSTTDSPVWRSLCALALVVSVVAAICTNLMRSQNATARISAAETANAELDSLQTMLEFGQVRLDVGLKLYQQSVAKVSFVDERLTGPSALR
jgi:exonuclease VII small subunit